MMFGIVIVKININVLRVVELRIERVGGFDDIIELLN